MKSSTYDRVFDNLINIILYSAFCAAVYGVLVVLISAVAVSFYDISWFGYWVFGAGLLPAIIVSAIMISYKVAIDRFDKIQYRDIWMAWATIVSYDMDGNTLAKCEKWIDENIDGLHRIREKSSHGLYDTMNFIFKQKTDAMAFKLMWEEKAEKNS